MTTTRLPTCLVSSTTNSTKVQADILEKSDKRIKVALQGTNITLVMTRSDPRRHYVGSMAGVEFSTAG